MLAGPRDFISQAVRSRKALGGGIRQAGILAAAGKMALLEMSARLKEDHHNARTFAQGESRVSTKIHLPLKYNFLNFTLFQRAPQLCLTVTNICLRWTWLLWRPTFYVST